VYKEAIAVGIVW